MTKQDALDMIDKHKNALINPVAMLHWTALRVVILQIPDDAWESYCQKAAEVMAL